jgi:hypothetical protein
LLPNTEKELASENLMENNMGLLDRVLRGLLGFLILWTTAVVTTPSGIFFWVGLGVTFLLLISAVMGFCPIYNVVGFSTRENAEPGTVGWSRPHAKADSPFSSEPFASSPRPSSILAPVRDDVQRPDPATPGAPGASSVAPTTEEQTNAEDARSGVGSGSTAQ